MNVIEKESSNRKEKIFMEENEGIMVQRVGNVLYTVRLKSSEGAKESYEAKLRKMIENAAISRVSGSSEQN